jgi:hypothetical protein
VIDRETFSVTLSSLAQCDHASVTLEQTPRGYLTGVYVCLFCRSRVEAQRAELDRSLDSELIGR